MTVAIPYALVGAAALPLVLVIARWSRHETARATWAWSLAEPDSEPLAPVAALAVFAIEHAAQAPRAAGPVLRAYCRAAAQVLSHWHVRARVAAARSGARCSVPRWLRARVVAARLRLIPFQVAYIVAFRLWGRLPWMSARLHRSHTALVALLTHAG